MTTSTTFKVRIVRTKRNNLFSFEDMFFNASKERAIQLGNQWGDVVKIEMVFFNKKEKKWSLI